MGHRIMMRGSSHFSGRAMSSTPPLLSRPAKSMGCLVADSGQAARDRAHREVLNDGLTIEHARK